MKTILLTSLAFLFVACSAEVRPVDDTTSEQITSDVDDESTDTATEPTSVVTNDLCKIRREGRGCLRATVSTAELYVGPFYYEIGVQQFAREFPEDMLSENMPEYPADYGIDFFRKITNKTFYNGFTFLVEGSHTAHTARHTDLGNIQIDDLHTGSYDVLISREFDLRVTDYNDRFVGYKCAVLWTREYIDVEEGRASTFNAPLSSFEVTIYDESCSGSVFRREVRNNTFIEDEFNTDDGETVPLDQVDEDDDESSDD